MIRLTDAPIVGFELFSTRGHKGLAAQAAGNTLLTFGYKMVARDYGEQKQRTKAAESSPLNGIVVSLGRLRIRENLKSESHLILCGLS